MCHRRQLSIVKLQNFIKLYSFLMCLMLLNSVHKLKYETNLTLLSTYATSTFHNGNVLRPLSETFPLNFIMHRCASYLSI